MVKVTSEKERNEFMDIKYDKEKATMWTSNLINECITNLGKLNKP